MPDLEEESSAISLEDCINSTVSDAGEVIYLSEFGWKYIEVDSCRISL